MHPEIAGKNDKSVSLSVQSESMSEPRLHALLSSNMLHVLFRHERMRFLKIPERLLPLPTACTPSKTDTCDVFRAISWKKY